MTTTNRLLRVFLCHASQDKFIVRELYQRLLAEGWIDPWLDEEKLLPGQDWDMEIEKAVELADAVIVCLSKNSVTKEGYVQKELKAVLDIAEYKPEGTIFIIPILLEDCQVPRRLKSYQYQDYFTNIGLAHKRLRASLNDRANAVGVDVVELQENFRSQLEAKAKEENEERIRREAEEKIRLEEEGILRKQAEEHARKRIEDEMRIRAETEARKQVEERIYNEEFIRQGLKGEQIRYTPSRHPIYPFGEIEYVKVSAGKFIMGGEKGSDYNKATRQYTFDIQYDYWIARFPVTNEQYYAYVKHLGVAHPVRDWEEKKDHPVTNISWAEAVAFSKWINQRVSYQLPKSYCLRLPSEAEWEKAARGINGWIFPWGNDFNEQKCNLLNVNQTTTPVGLFSPQGDSPYGCADMIGNIWEWTNSLMKPPPYTIYDGREDEKSKGRRVLKGGSFLTGSVECADRVTSVSEFRFLILKNINYVINKLEKGRGFRLALSVPFL